MYGRGGSDIAMRSRLLPHMSRDGGRRGLEGWEGEGERGRDGNVNMITNGKIE